MRTSDATFASNEHDLDDDELDRRTEAVRCGTAVVIRGTKHTSKSSREMNVVIHEAALREQQGGARRSSSTAGATTTEADALGAVRDLLDALPASIDMPVRGRTVRDLNSSL
jgi:gamma-glutamyl phosphate reductase